MMKQNTIKPILYILVLGLTLVNFLACTQKNKEEVKNDTLQEEVKKEADIKTLRFQLKNAPVSLDPIVDVDAITSMVTSNIFEGLVKFNDSNVSIKPALAERWEINEDGLEYTFFLRRGVLFHDDTKLNADVVVKNFDRLIEMYAYSSGWSKKFVELIKSVEKKDEYTVKFVLEQQYTPFLTTLAMNKFTPIVSLKTLQDGADVNDNPIGTGPFIFRKWSKGENIILEKNKNYWGNKPNIDKIDFRLDAFSTSVASGMLRNNEIDVIDLDKSVSLGDEINYYQADMLMSSFIALNCSRAPFNDLNNRLAVAHAINRRELFETNYSDVAFLKNSYLSGELPSFDSSFSFYSFDVDKARRFSNVEENTNIEIIDTIFNDNSFNHDIARDLSRINLDANFIGNLYSSEFQDRLLKGNYDILMFAWRWENPDPNSLVGIVDPDNMGLNVSKYFNEELKSLAKKGMTFSYGENRDDVYRQIQRILKEDVVIIPMFEMSRIFAFGSNVRNFRTHPTGRVMFDHIDLVEG